jgi:D-alanine-D-alanine ligase
LYDSGAADWTQEDVHAVLGCVDATSQALEQAGHDVECVAVSSDFTWLDRVRAADAVCNLCEGVGGESHLEAHVASTIELLGVPTTGASASTMVMCYDQSMLNAILAAKGLPIPEWRVPADDTDLDDFPLPAIVKPASEDASVGVDQDAVVTDAAELRERVAWARKQFGDVVVQQYIAGREIAVAFVSDEVLPLSEIDFSMMPGDHWPIVTFEAKWSPDSPDYKGTIPVCPADIDDELENRIVAIASDAWNAVQGHGYGRVDFRLDNQGSPWLLEVNPNPDSSPDAGLANMARAHGWTYNQLVMRIFAAAFVATQPAGAPLG